MVQNHAFKLGASNIRVSKALSIERLRRRGVTYAQLLHNDHLRTMLAAEGRSAVGNKDDLADRLTLKRPRLPPPPAAPAAPAPRAAAAAPPTPEQSPPVPPAAAPAQPEPPAGTAPAGPQAGGAEPAQQAGGAAPAEEEVGGAAPAQPEGIPEPAQQAGAAAPGVDLNKFYRALTKAYPTNKRNLVSELGNLMGPVC